MRKLIFKDAFTMAKIIKKAGIKEDISSFLKDNANQNKTAENLGIDISMLLFTAVGTETIEKDIYNFLEDVFEVKNVQNMSFEEVGSYFKKLASENNLKDFFNLASR